MKNKIIISLVLFFMGLYAEEITLPTLTISSDKNIVSSGETISITATITGWDENKWGMPVSTLFSGVRLNNGNNYNIFDDTSPYQWNISYPIDYAGIEKYEATILFGKDYISSNELSIVVKPDLSTLKQLKYIEGKSIVLSPGYFEQLRVIGLFSDGHERDVTSGQLGTIYSENIVNGTTITTGNSPSISVSADGLITAIAPGEAEVVATNNGRTAIRRIKVVAVEDGDADGDGLSNTQEDTIGTNKYHPDSDGDGLNDKIEVGADPTHPLDNNNDGTIDALDNTVMAIKDSSGNYVSISTSAGSLFSPLGKKLTDYPSRQGDLSQIDMERGLLSFHIEGLVAGQSVDVTLDFDSLATGTNKYLKYGRKLPGGNNKEWYEFTNFDISGNRIVLHLTDNQLGDSNPIPGVITDPGGPGKILTTANYDFDGDGDIDVVDINKVSSHWYSKVGDIKYDSAYDLNSDDVIDIKDIMMVASQWGM